MTNQHPITPPPELVNQWWLQAQSVHYVVTQAAQWGSDQELEACCDWLIEHGYDIASPELRASRRPKPPSLKEQALDALSEAESTGCLYVNGRSDLIRKALEALPNDL